jgi:hypothetical protein
MKCLLGASDAIEVSIQVAIRPYYAVIESSNGIDDPQSIVIPCDRIPIIVEWLQAAQKEIGAANETRQDCKA